MTHAFHVIDFPGLSGAAPAAQPSAAPAQLDGPLATRFPWRLTIAGKAIYYDAAGTTTIPHTLSEALILLWVCSHPTEQAWQSREPEHEDGVDSALPLGLDLVELRRHIAKWADGALRHDEDVAAVLMAQTLWIHGHATFATPTGEPAQKKTKDSSTGLSPTSSTSPTETQPSGTMSSTGCSSETPTHPSMPDSKPQESPV